METARLAEQLGFDAYAIGERHAGPFLSAGVTVVLGAIATTTTRIRLQTGVAMLSVLDPLRVVEDYATIDQLSRGRLELVIGKSNEARHFPMFGLYLEDQWDLPVSKSGGSGTTTPTRPSRLEWLQDRAWQAEAGEEALVAEPRHRRDLVF